ncbi:MAG: hypothetical protein KBT03_09520 [Bacteroidales bacterium]|nr:hypothetical protein [Candidatus Scybalousia scybalohippi]
MSLKIDNDNIIDIFSKDKKIARVYDGNQLVWGYHPGEVIFESSTPGTYQVKIKCNCKIRVILVGAGGGAASWGGYYSNNYTWNSSGGGGSGAYIDGVLSVLSGTYNAVVGVGGNYFRDDGIGSHFGYAGDGSSSSFVGNIAGGGKGGFAANTAIGGTGGIYQSDLVGVNGEDGSGMEHVVSWGSYPIQNIDGGSSKYGGYGYGGYINDRTMNNAVGGNGYIKIVAV